MGPARAQAVMSTRNQPLPRLRPSHFRVGRLTQRERLRTFKNVIVIKVSHTQFEQPCGPQDPLTEPLLPLSIWAPQTQTLSGSCTFWKRHRGLALRSGREPIHRQVHAWQRQQAGSQPGSADVTSTHSCAAPTALWDRPQTRACAPPQHSAEEPTHSGPTEVLPWPWLRPRT